MKPTLGQPFTPDWAGLPPAMSPEDFRIWNRTRALFADAEALYYNVRLGDGQPISERETDDSMRKMWRDVTSKRADVVALYRDRWRIIELRFDAGPNAIGRLLAYLMLWRRDPPDRRPVSAILITDREDLDVRDLAQASGLDYHVSPAVG